MNTHIISTCSPEIGSTHVTEYKENSCNFKNSTDHKEKNVHDNSSLLFRGVEAHLGILNFCEHEHFGHNVLPSTNTTK